MLLPRRAWPTRREVRRLRLRCLRRFGIVAYAWDFPPWNWRESNSLVKWNIPVVWDILYAGIFGSFLGAPTCPFIPGEKARQAFRLHLRTLTSSAVYCCL